MNNTIKRMLVELIGAGAIIMSFVMQVILKMDFRKSCLTMAIYAIFIMIYICLYKIDKNEEVARKNQLIFMYQQAIKIVMALGATIEYHFERVSMISYAVIIVTCAILVVVDLEKYTKNIHSEKLITQLLISYFIIYIMVVFMIKHEWVIFLPLPLLTASIVFNDMKTLNMAYLLVHVGTLIAAVIQVITIYGQDPMKMYHILSFVCAGIFVSGYCICVTRTSQLIQQDENNKISDVERKKKEAEDLASDVVKLGRLVKENASSTQKIVNEIGIGCDNAIIAFEDIASGNISNGQSVEKQIEMTDRIIELINRVRKDVDHVSKATKEAYEGLGVSKNSVEEIQGESNVILVNNKEVFAVITEFVDNVKKVRSIINGISDISEQTNLLSLNASIESARAGESGKGFSVVASEIQSLSDETAVLTNDINEIVNTLEKSAIRAQKVIGIVDNSINDEDKIINETKGSIDNIQSNLDQLVEAIKLILDKVEEVVEYNVVIKEQSSKLDISSEAVLDKTQGAKKVNIDNRENVNKSKELMEKLIKVVEQLDDYVME